MPTSDHSSDRPVPLLPYDLIYGKGFSTVDLLLRTTRTFEILTDRMASIYAGVGDVVDQLNTAGLIIRQDGCYLDRVTGEVRTHRRRSVPRYVLTGEGRRVAAMAAERGDAFVLERWPCTQTNADGVASLLDHLADRSDEGMSTRHVHHATQMPKRSINWWMSQLCDQGLARQIGKMSDDNPLIGPSYYPTPLFGEAVRALGQEIPGWRVKRRRWPGPADLVGQSSLFIHTYRVQQIIAALMARNRVVAGEGAILSEPHLTMPATISDQLATITRDGVDELAFSPDAVVQQTNGRSQTTTFVEYEHRRSHKSVRGHLGRALGWSSVHLHPQRGIAVRFVVDTQERAVMYRREVDDYQRFLQGRPEFRAPNPTVVHVALLDEILQAPDPYVDGLWSSTDLPTGEGTPVAPTTTSSPSQGVAA